MVRASRVQSSCLKAGAIRDGYLIGPEADILCTPFSWRDLDRGEYGRFSAYFNPDKFGLTKVDEPYCR